MSIQPGGRTTVAKVVRPVLLPMVAIHVVISALVPTVEPEVDQNTNERVLRAAMVQRKVSNV